MNIEQDAVAFFYLGKYQDRISSVMKKHLYDLRQKVLKPDVQLEAGNVTEVIKFLEGEENVTPSVRAFVKIPWEFKKALYPYKHAHVPLSPSAYLNMFIKDPNDPYSGFKKHVQDYIDKCVKNEIAPTIEGMEALIDPDERGCGRMTGDWLIFEEIDGVNYYYALLPHGKGDIDDAAYKKIIDRARSEFFKR